MTPPQSTALLAEQIGLGLLRERRLDHPRAGGAERGAVRECKLERAPARILRDSDDGRSPVALLVQPRARCARALSAQP